MSEQSDFEAGIETLKAGRCPKCAFTTGWHGPKFIPGARVPMAAGGFVRVTGDRLAFASNRCGYEFYTPTYDAPPLPPQPPPQPPPESDPGVSSIQPRRGAWRAFLDWMDSL